MHDSIFINRWIEIMQSPGLDQPSLFSPPTYHLNPLKCLKHQDHHYSISLEMTKVLEQPTMLTLNTAVELCTK